MKIFPVALALFHKINPDGVLEVWVQTRTDDGPYHGLLEFPGGGVEASELPIEAVVREVEEEVGITISGGDGRLMGIYSNELAHKTILLYVFLFPEHLELNNKGQWLKIDRDGLSSPYKDQIPFPNHKIIDDLYLAVYDGMTNE